MFTLILLQELIEQEKQFTEKENAKKNRTTVLQVLKELSPKLPHNNKVTTLNVIRSSIKRLADDSIWQNVSALGRPGTKMLSMREVMPNLMDIILLTAINLLKADPKEATAALSTYMKGTSYRETTRKETKNRMWPY